MPFTPRPTRRRLRGISLVVALLVVLASCSSADEGPSESDPGASAAPQATVPVASYALLSESELEGTLLELDGLPPGYSQDPPTESGNKYFCDYDPPTEERYRVRRDFTKGGGLSAEVVSLTIRQFESVEDAEASWDALVEVTRTCDSEVFEGSTLNYSPLSALDLGDASVGVKIDSDGVTILQNFVRVGPSIVSGGGGGLVAVDADTIADLLAKQVDRYTAAASS